MGEPMKPEPIGGAITLWAIAATTGNPILYTLAGSVAGACVGASVMEGTPTARAVRLFVSLAAGFFIAAAIHSVASVHGLMVTPADVLEAARKLQVQESIGWIMGLVSLGTSLIAWPLMRIIEQRAAPFFRKLIGSAEARIVPDPTPAASVVTRRRKPPVVADHGGMDAARDSEDGRND
jgi:hypothetical protein